MCKRVFDVALSSVGIFLLLPLGVLFALAIWLQDGSPVFYIQERVGKDCGFFKVIKFRTLGYKKPNSRLAGFLRSTALDELPQLINIVRGEMSFVGPRPLVPEEVIVYKEDLGSRGKVLPGLTGAAQILVSKDAPIPEKLRYDRWYVENRNFLMDIRFLHKSLWVSVRKRWDKTDNSVKKVAATI
jgi:lipopolysaccharide/colanic/teichoic acid biosynthesis glycosyltransferase